MAGRLSWHCNFSLSRVTGETVSIKIEHGIWPFWDEIIIGMTTPGFPCEAEASCRRKLASSKGRTLGCSGVGVGLSKPFCGKCEFVNDVGGEAAVDVRELINELLVWSAEFGVFRWLNFKSVGWLMQTRTNIISKMMHHWIFPPILPKKPWSMLSTLVVESLSLSPVDSITLGEVSSILTWSEFDNNITCWLLLFKIWLWLESASVGDSYNFFVIIYSIY